MTDINETLKQWREVCERVPDECWRLKCTHGGALWIVSNTQDAEPSVCTLSCAPKYEDWSRAKFIALSRTITPRLIEAVKLSLYAFNKIKSGHPIDPKISAENAIEIIQRILEGEPNEQ